MTLEAAEFIRRFLLHVLPSGFHRIRHYGLIRWNGSSAQHRARPPIARRAQGLAPARARRARQRDRDTFASAPMPVLRRPDDHRRDLRWRAPRAFPSPNPHQDRQLMTTSPRFPPRNADLSSPSAARRSRKALSLTRSADSLQAPRPRQARPSSRLEQARRRRSRREACAPPASAVTRPGRPRPSNPHRSRPTKQRPSSPRFPPWEAFERRPPARTTSRTGAGVRNPSPKRKFLRGA